MSDLIVTPRGGGDEVGRSCYHLQAGDYDYFIDCGLKQSETPEYPLFEDVSQGQIDAVFITHAHIDHIGGLPVAEHHGLLDDDASIFMTRPTNALASILLHDSLQIHKQETAELNQPQQFTATDIEQVLSRIMTIGYNRNQHLNITYECGDAAHLLGSAWIAIEYNDRCIVFSGDLGGRSAHLGDIDDPPEADELFLESTYGETLQHRSFTDARTELYQQAKQAIASGIPVLIPTFAVGRAQEILQIFRERETDLRNAVNGEPSIIYDGMITDSMSVYEVFCQDAFMSESMLNYRINSGDVEPFTPECARTPDTMDEREQLLTGDEASIVIAPSGMLTGGWSPYYLRDLTRHYENARVLFIGYQAQGTPGRRLIEASGDIADVYVTALPASEDYDPVTGEFAFQDQEIHVPTEWIHEIGGMSAHAGANDLLSFARQVNPQGISLIHGPPNAAAHLQEYLSDNTTASTIQVAQHLEPIPIEIERGNGDEQPALDSAPTSASTSNPDITDSDIEEVRQRQERLEAELETLRDKIEYLIEKG
ncbi:MBL fold metallo-hydrolase [Haloquadratum walsbyi]|uniref:Beta-lactamase domain protein n=1 Tax=Haloquadratum walsbyi (strain DSM 16790 / HBSQ001) TaxID=362976 RepID=Q18IP5_HALWD|nr:MBL fold metallo-hydrolase [Haloquadratum walsbyi]CAJ52124.1 beta-lactamase domain protein [Haloquadratum walsbyi DSM 16790]